MNGLMDKWIVGCMARRHAGESSHPTVHQSNNPSFGSSLVQIFLDALGLSQQIRRMFLGQLDEFF
jgi:hypothetical protein